METTNETASEGAWPLTDLEAAARDMLDVGFWESAEEEEVERAVADSVPTVPTLADVPEAAYTVDE